MLCWAIGLLLSSAGMGFAQTIDTTLWVTNGEVNAVVRDGGTIYIGGFFTYVGPATGGGVAIDASTGAVQQPYPMVAGDVRAVAPDGSGGWYIGGSFTAVRAQPRNNLAHLDAAGNLTAWDPNANGTVSALAVSGGTVYAGGGFNSIGGQPHGGIAALDAATGTATSWNPAGGTVLALAVSGGTVYAGGFFTFIGGKARNHLAALDAATGAATSWNPNANGPVFALAVSGGTVYAGGDFSMTGGQSRVGIAALDAATGVTTSWNANANYAVYALAVSGGTVYASGSFGQSPAGIAALDAATGAATSWNANANSGVDALAVSGGTVYAGGSFTSIGGQPRSYLAALDAATGAVTSWNPNVSGGVLALAVSGGTVYAGGEITGIGLQARSNVAALDAATGAATSWNPNANGQVLALAVSGGTVYAGGFFTSIGLQPRNYLAALDAAAGAATSWDPSANGSVSALAVSGGTAYAGGDFTSIGGQTRNHVAALDAATGAATSWNPSADAPVHALVVSGSTVYAGGVFTWIGGQPRAYLAALDAATGAATSWSQGTNIGVVFALAESGNTVYVGHDWNGSYYVRYLHALDAATGAATSWDPIADGPVHALVVSGGTVYAGGVFTAIGGQPRNYLAALDAETGAATSWNPNANGPVYALEVSGSTVYAGGGFTAIAGQPRGGIAGFQGVPILRLSALPQSFNAVTVGDTTSKVLAIRNIGLAPLTISGLEAPSPFSFNPSPPFGVPPGSEATVSVIFHPVVESARDSGLIRITSDDPYSPMVSVPVSFEALGLNFQTQALTTGDTVPLGQAITIQVVPEPGHHAERGAVYFRAAGQTTFDHVDLVPYASTFIGIIPGSAVREAGVEYYVRLENSGVFAPDPRGAPQDSLFRIAVAAPTSIAAFPQPTSRSDFLPDSAIVVEVTLPAGAIPTSDSLHFRRGGEIDYGSGALAPSPRPEILLGTIPASVVGPRGVEYWVEVNTLTTTTALTFPAAHPEATPDTIRVTVRSLLEPRPHPGERYRMLGLPLDGRGFPNLDELLSSQFGRYDPLRWRVFRYLPEDSASLEVSPGDLSGRFRAVPGRAFWLISRDDHQVDTGLAPGLSTPTGSAYAIVLASGWNQIANPFDFPVAWAAVGKPGGMEPPVAFDPALGTRGDYAEQAPEVLEPFEGYFVWNGSAEPETLWVPPVEAPPATPPAAGAATRGLAQDDGWRLRLRAHTEHAVDGSNFVGVAAAAAEGVDALDLLKPPAPPGAWVRLGLRLPAEGARDLYRVDLREPSGEGHAWEFVLRRSTAGELVTLEALAPTSLPDGLSLRLIDRELSSAVDLRLAGGSPASYRLLSLGPSRPYRLTLLAGSEAFVSQAQAAELAIPSRLVMDPAVPNPARAPMRIRFGVPRAQAVTVEIFDLLGRRVALLLDRTWQTPGYHALLWDGSGHGVGRVPRGIYVCRLSSSGGVVTRKLVRLE
jgi:predicted small secreted protein